MENNFREKFKNKSVLITGHTGFKGSWLTMWLNISGAKIAGISNDYPSSLNHYQLLNLRTFPFYNHLIIRKIYHNIF